MLLWSIIMAAGAVLSYFVSQYIAVATFVIWLILFLRMFILMLRKLFKNIKLNS